MAGIKAGGGDIATLSIGLVAKIDQLQRDLDAAKRIANAASQDIARSAKHANDNLRSIGRGASGNIFEFSREVARLKGQIDPAWASLQRYKQQVDLLRQALAQGAITHKQFVDQMRLAVNTYRGAGDAVVKSAGAQRAGMQQLSMQIGDMATMYSLGARPMQIFASQSGQVIQAISLMQGGASKFSTFMMGPWGMALTAATLVLVPLIASLLDGKKASDELGDASETLSDKLNMQVHSIEEVTAALRGYNVEQQRARDGMLATLVVQARVIAGNLREAASIRQKLSADMSNTTGKAWAAFQAGGLGGGIAAYRQIEADMRAQQSANDALIKLLNSASENAVGEIAAEIAKINTDPVYKLKVGFDQMRKSAIEAGGGVEVISRKLEEINRQEKAAEKAYKDSQKKPSSNKGEQSRLENLARQAQATEALISGLYKTAEAYRVSEAAGMKAEITAKATEQGIRRRADLDAYVAQQIKLNAAQKVQEAAKEAAALIAQTEQQRIYNNQVAKGLITSEEAQRLLRDEASIRSIVVAMNMAEGKAKANLAKEVANLRERQKEANAEAQRAQDLAKTAAYNEQIRQIQGEIAMINDLGMARRDALRGLSGDALEDELARLNAEQQKRTIWLRAEAEILQLVRDGNLQAAEAAWMKAAAETEAVDAALQWEKAAVKIERVNDQYREMIQLLHQIGGFAGVLGDIFGIVTGDFNSVSSPFLQMLLNTRGADGKKIGDQIKVSLEDLFNDTFGPGGLFGATLQQSLMNAGMGVSAASAVGLKGTGSQIGSGIGGAIGGALGTKLIGGLMGGPIGAIALGLLGGLVGSLFGGAKKGIVSIGGSGSTLSVGGTKHSNSELVGQATQSANAIIDSLNQIADVLGGSIDATKARLTIGMRDEKWVIDTLGQARTKGAGVMSFSTQEEAAKAAIKLMLERGVIAGIRESTMNLLRSGNDLEAALEKALAFESVFKELESASNPFVASLKELQANISQLTAIFQEAGATAEEYAALQELIALKQQQLIDQASANYRSTFYSDAENAAFARQTISSTLTPLGYGHVDTVEEYKALVEATDALANPELYGTLMDLSDEFGVLKDAADSAKQAAEAERLAKEALAAQRGQMEVELLRLQGKELEAVAKARQLELAALDPSLRALQKQIHEAQDIADAREVLSQAYQRERSELEQTAEKLRGLGDSLREFRESIYASDSTVGGFERAMAEWRKVQSLAAFGDQDAMGKLPGVGRDLLDAASNRASTLQDYQRIQAMVARGTDAAIGAADAGVTVAEQQLSELQRIVEGLGVATEEVVSVADAIDRLTALIAPTPSGGSGGSSDNEREEALERVFDRLFEGVRERLDRSERGRRETNDRLGALNSILKRVERNGALAIVTDKDTPILTESAP